MALKSTIFKAQLSIADMDRNYYAEHQLTLACHPSESPERMMIGLLAFALNAHERLSFTRGLSDAEEPDLWQRDLSGGLELWIELGHPEEKRLAKACGKSKAVIVYAYSASPRLWWDPISARFAKTPNLSVRSFPPAHTKALSLLVERSMNLSCAIQDGEIWFRDDKGLEARIEQTILR
jgi:uncharacterized protein YaeQ